MVSKGDFQNGGHKTPFREHVSLNYQNNASGRTVLCAQMKSTTEMNK